MQNAPTPQRSPAFLSDCRQQANKHSSEPLRDFWKSEHAVHAIWAGQAGQIFIQLLFLMLFDPFFRDYLPNKEYPDRTNFYADLFGWGALGGPLFTPFLLIPVAIGRIWGTWKGNKGHALGVTIALVGISWFLGYIQLGIGISAWD